MNPPLREGRDKIALRQALADGIIDCVATDHAPHAAQEKCCEFANARPGMLGLQTALSIVIETMVNPGLLDWRGVAAVMSERPAQITGLPDQGRPIAVGEPANLALVDPDTEWTVESRRAGQPVGQLAVRRPHPARHGDRHGAAGRDHEQWRQGPGSAMTGVVVVLIVILAWCGIVGLMILGWRGRGRRQEQTLGAFPEVPPISAPAGLGPHTGLYVGSTIAPSWQDRVAVGDYGDRGAAETQPLRQRDPDRTPRCQPDLDPRRPDHRDQDRTRAGRKSDDRGRCAGDPMAVAVGNRDRLRHPRGRQIHLPAMGQTFQAGRNKAVTQPNRATPAVLVLENGEHYTGTGYGALGQTLGEAVFCTAMTGYQETLTDPSYHRQIVVATAPQIGNTGWNRQDGESRIGNTGQSGDDSGKIWVSGYAVRNPTRRVSSWRATSSLEDELVEQGIVGIAGIDTRTVVRTLRDHGSMRAGIFSGDALAEVDELLQRVVDAPQMKGANLAGEVSTTEGYVVEPDGEPRFTVAAIDLGIKTNTPRMFAQRGVRVHVLPAGTSPEAIAAIKPDGVFLSNGPGDPATADHAVDLTRHVLGEGIPLFGICFGNQILGRALGRGHLQDEVRSPRHQHPGHRSCDRCGVDHRAEPRVRARG